ncbi:Hypothetical_protein [Hexamita inflata]|uniref:Hypothetical_protein n=1 Tax=Hexamita inflata TaxID=28002 RepID=A0AA86QHW4_9EUKA|nr:Hypothetical protein HINF_LOCUS41154 [Hexamita inflata]
MRISANVQFLTQVRVVTCLQYNHSLSNQYSHIVSRKEQYHIRVENFKIKESEVVLQKNLTHQKSCGASGFQQNIKNQQTTVGSSDTCKAFETLTTDPANVQILSNF